jgi:GH24 family phage-related lysozyme (muramidase)
MQYNMGSFYKHSGHQSMTALLNSPGKWGDQKYVESVFLKYCNPGTPVEKGLRRRRKAEAELFCTPVGKEK